MGLLSISQTELANMADDEHRDSEENQSRCEQFAEQQRASGNFRRRSKGPGVEFIAADDHKGPGVRLKAAVAEPECKARARKGALSCKMLFIASGVWHRLGSAEHLTKVAPAQRKALRAANRGVRRSQQMLPALSKNALT